MYSRRKKLRALLAVIIPIAVIFVCGGVCFALMPHLSADAVGFHLYCDTFPEGVVSDEAPRKGDITSGYYLDTEYFSGEKLTYRMYAFGSNVYWKAKIIQAAFLIELVPMKPTDEVITDAEIYRIVFRKDGSQIKTVTFAYDFYQKKTYAYKDGEWYTFKENFAFNKLLSMVWENPWDCEFRGQSIYSDGDAELFYEEEDFANLTFRYNLKWSRVEGLKDDSGIDYNYRDSGFKNVDAKSVTNSDTAVARAAEELGYSEYVGVAFYDKTNGYWMVEIHENTEQLKEAREDDARYYELLYENVYTVIIDNTATTLEIYKSCTTFLQFAYAGIIGGKA